jgi:hypothetical protein
MQGAKLESLIGNIRANSLVGMTMKYNINYLQLLAGIEEPVMSLKIVLPYIKENWLTQLQNYLITIKAKLHIDGLLRFQ